MFSPKAEGEFNSSRDVPQQVALAVAAPLSSGSNPGMWPVPAQSVGFQTWEREAVRTQAGQVRNFHVGC